MYIELTDVQEIAAAQQVFARQLRIEFPHRRRRVIGYPAGHFEADVRFAASAGDHVEWWWGSVSENGRAFLNLFGRGNPETRNAVYIDLQFNLPRQTFSRSHGAIFVREIETGMIVIGHRAIVTRGRSRVPKDLLLGEVHLTQEQVVSEIAPGSVNVLLVGQIDRSGISQEIRDFSIEVRRAASTVAQFLEEKQSSTTGSHSLTSAQRFQIGLEEYFDEFMGMTSARRLSNVRMNFQHGRIVRSLRDQLDGKGEIFKSQAVDLVLVTRKKVKLYEVKTNTKSQSIYTGIGQLYMHGAVLERQFPGRKLIRYLVFPGVIDERGREILQKDLRVSLIPYEFGASGTNFAGL